MKSLKWKIVMVIGVILITLYFFSLPDRLFRDPYSTVVEDRSGNLLSATTAADGQWRFPQEQYVPEKFKDAITLFEDKRFYHHWGVDPRSLARAIRQNLNAGKIISGGSTLTMQVIRLSRKNQSRTFVEKFIELFLATRLEWRYSKEEIMALYSAHAPFGGNVVGLEAACWRYFGRGSDELSWSEAALLAVLPNNPSLIHLGRNRDELKAKRDRLLNRLMVAGKMDDLTLRLAIAEPVPQEPKALPRSATHLLNRIISDGKAQQKIVSTLDESIQTRLLQIVDDHYQRLQGKQVFNAAALIVHVPSGKVLAYVGNTNSGNDHQQQVDVIQAPRSTGSILKPFLYAALLDEGKLLPQMLVPDVPTVINGFSPKNFSREYDGAVPADQALIRSLNIPAVIELRTFRYEKFYELLKNIGMTTLTKPADHYGLALILGGADGSLWDITGAYASMARTLNNYFEHPGANRYSKKDFHPPVYVNPTDTIQQELSPSSWLSAGSIYQTFETLKEVYRPGEETGWQLFNSTKKIAWKTGTSHGHRDAWAVGVNPEYAVGVWVGNADGEGRPGLTGTELAAPMLFDIFSSLPGNNSWFQKPKSEFRNITSCTLSGQRATPYCERTAEAEVLLAGLQVPSCGYHKSIHLTQDLRFRVHADCESLDKMKAVNWFVLPPVQEYYFRSKNLSYKSLPPFRSDCTNPNSLTSMDVVYPKPNAQVFLPRALDGSAGSTIFEAVHRQRNATIYWHLDGNFIATTQNSHKISVSTGKGKHVLTLVDGAGEVLERQFFVIFES